MKSLQWGFRRVWSLCLKTRYGLPELFCRVRLRGGVWSFAFFFFGRFFFVFGFSLFLDGKGIEELHIQGRK